VTTTRRYEPFVVTAISLVVFFVLWEIVWRIGRFPPSVFAGPGQVAAALGEMVASGELARDVVASTSQFLLGYLLAAAAGIAVGLALGVNEDAEAVFSPYLMALYAAPRVAFISLLLIWLGAGLTLKVVLVFLSAFFPICVNTIAGAKGVDPTLLEAGRAFGASRWQTFTKIVVPSAVPFIFAGLRLGVGRGLIGMFVAELFGAEAGLGYLIQRAGFELKAAQVFAGVLVLMVLSVALHEGVAWLGRRLAPWREESVV
jgi:NitT/TauT family transport system permease protein